nr:cytochrome P450 [Tanacetum cinerariifolium]
MYTLKVRPYNLDEAFLLARAMEARFMDLQLWKLLRSNPTTLGEAFFKARITDARFEDERSTTAIAKANDLNTGVHVQDLELETKSLNDKYTKKKKIKVAIQRRLWDPGIKSVFQDNTLRAM